MQEMSRHNDKDNKNSNTNREAKVAATTAKQQQRQQQSTQIMAVTIPALDALLSQIHSEQRREDEVTALKSPRSAAALMGRKQRMGRRRATNSRRGTEGNTINEGDFHNDDDDNDNDNEDFIVSSRSAGGLVVAKGHVESKPRRIAFVGLGGGVGGEARQIASAAPAVIVRREEVGAETTLTTTTTTPFTIDTRPIAAALATVSDYLSLQQLKEKGLRSLLRAGKVSLAKATGEQEALRRIIRSHEDDQTALRLELKMLSEEVERGRQRLEALALETVMSTRFAATGSDGGGKHHLPRGPTSERLFEAVQRALDEMALEEAEDDDAEEDAYNQQLIGDGRALSIVSGVGTAVVSAPPPIFPAGSFPRQEEGGRGGGGGGGGGGVTFDGSPLMETARPMKRNPHGNNNNDHKNSSSDGGERNSNVSDAFSGGVNGGGTPPPRTLSFPTLISSTTPTNTAPTTPPALTTSPSNSNSNSPTKSPAAKASSLRRTPAAETPPAAAGNDGRVNDNGGGSALNQSVAFSSSLNPNAFGSHAVMTPSPISPSSFSASPSSADHTTTSRSGWDGSVKGGVRFSMMMMAGGGPRRRVTARQTSSPFFLSQQQQQQLLQQHHNNNNSVSFSTTNNSTTTLTAATTTMQTHDLQQRIADLARANHKLAGRCENLRVANKAFEQSAMFHHDEMSRIQQLLKDQQTEHARSMTDADVQLRKKQERLSECETRIVPKLRVSLTALKEHVAVLESTLGNAREEVFAQRMGFEIQFEEKDAAIEQLRAEKHELEHKLRKREAAFATIPSSSSSTATILRAASSTFTKKNSDPSLLASDVPSKHNDISSGGGVLSSSSPQGRMHRSKIALDPLTGEQQTAVSISQETNETGSPLPLARELQHHDNALPRSLGNNAMSPINKPPPLPLSTSATLPNHNTNNPSHHNSPSGAGGVAWESLVAELQRDIVRERAEAVGARGPPRKLVPIPSARKGVSRK